jgi:hypothetical protein
MKRIRILFLVIILAIISSVSIVSCDKSGDTENDFVSYYVNTTIFGTVFDENHLALENSKVTAYGRVRYTDENGVFVFENIPVPKSRCFVVVESDNYFKIMRSKAPNKNGVTRMDAELIPLTNNQSFISGNAYTANLAGESSIIDFPATANFVDQYGNPYSGTVNIHAVSIDPTSSDYSRQAPAGDQMGMDNGIPQVLITEAGMLIELTDDNGNPLNLEEGSTANLAIEIPGGAGTSPIDLYYASANNANNNREGTATESGGRHESVIGHFSYWSTQLASPEFGTLNCRVVDNLGNAVPNTRVKVGQAYNITNSDGIFQMKVPAGINIEMRVMAQDFYGISSNIVNQTWNVGETQYVELTINDDVEFVKGTLVDCNNNPVNGLVSLSWSNGMAVSNTVTESGMFKLPTNSGFGPYVLQIKSTYKDTLISIELDTLVSITDLGNVSLCDFAPSLYNYIQLNEGDTVLRDYTNFYSTFDGYLYQDSLTGDPIETNIEFSGIDGSFTLYLSSVGSVGTYNIEDFSSQPSFVRTNPSWTFPIETGTVTITRYDPVGGIIKGVLDGATMYDHIHVEFEVNRSHDVIGVY